MRNTTKLKHILGLYSVTLDQSQEGLMELTLYHKTQETLVYFEGRNYSEIIDKAYRHLQREIREAQKSE